LQHIGGLLDSKFKIRIRKIIRIARKRIQQNEIPFFTEENIDTRTNGGL